MKDYKKIIEKYPLLFEGGDLQSPFSLYGFECDIGWYHIIENACHIMYQDYLQSEQQYNYAQSRIEKFDAYIGNRRLYDTATSKEDILKELEISKSSFYSKMQEALSMMPKVAQIKEKFGTLRFYIDGGNATSNAIAHYAELMSETTCEVCGNAGKTYYMKWHRTLCDLHATQNYGEEQVAAYIAKTPQILRYKHIM